MKKRVLSFDLVLKMFNQSNLRLKKLEEKMVKKKCLENPNQRKVIPTSKPKSPPS